MRDMFSQSKRIAELSKHFVMVNAYDNDEPEDDHYAPDGGYVPRTLFFGMCHVIISFKLHIKSNLVNI